MSSAALLCLDNLNLVALFTSKIAHSHYVALVGLGMLRDFSQQNERSAANSTFNGLVAFA